jgi:hypothetical protein
MILTIECVLVVAALVAALMLPHLGEPWFLPIERSFAKLAKSKRLSVVVVGLTTLILRLALLPVIPIPDPAIHDEFSYLLAADTFAHGRLANPTHPMWVHFETFHVNQKPAYVSMYYPGQALFLAAGQVMFGNPYWGVWFSAGLMCAAICWMLQGWLPPMWAQLGGLLVVIRLGTYSYWMNSYWGGAVAALGGALVLGALPRIRRHQRLRDSVLMGIGFAILANTRPYESLFFTLPILTWFVIWLRSRNAPQKRILILHVVLPLAILLVATLAAMGYYFRQTTGSAFLTPFSVNVSTYNPVPYFPWQRMKTIPEYHHPVLRAFYLNWWMRQYQYARSHPVMLLLLKASTFWYFFMGALFTLPLFVAVFAVPRGISFRQFSRRTKLLTLICASVMIGALLPVFFNPHYIAAITAAIYALILFAMQKVRKWRPHGRRAGVAVVRFVVVIAIFMFVLRTAVPPSRGDNAPFLATWYAPVVFNSYRAGVLAQLSAEPGLHLVIVRYPPYHVPANEWVYNGADIDGSKVVFARDMGFQKNHELLDYYKSRQIWVVNADEVPPKLSLYKEDVPQFALN